MPNPENENGVSVIEVLIAAFLFAVMVTGISALISSTMTQQQLDIKQQLAALAVNNGAERFLCFVRDHCGSASLSGGSEGACDTDGKRYTRTYDGTLADSPMPPELISLCPGCRMKVDYTCSVSLNLWSGEVSVKDTAHENIVFATVNPNVFQDRCD